MKLLHISDIHLGKHVNEFPMLEDQRYILGQILGILESRQVDALLIAGDVYDKSTPSAEAVALLDWFLREVARANVPCFIIAGNHDSAERIAFGQSFFAERGVHVSPVFDGTCAHHTLHDEHGPVTVWLMPFVKPAQVRPIFPDAEIGTDYTLACQAVIDACPIDENTRNVLLSHQFVTSGGTVTERCDSELSLGGIDNVNAAVFDAFDYVALGHVHRPQRVGREEVRYSGSPLKYSLSEARYPKTAPLVTLGEKGHVEVELVPLAPLHDLREIKGPLELLIAPETLEGISAREKEDYLHVTLTDEQPPMHALAALRAVYPNVMALDYENARTRSEGLNGSVAQVNAENVDPCALFGEFYEKQNGTPLSDVQSACIHALLEEAE